MKQSGLFDMEFRMRKIDSNSDPLKRFNGLLDWELFIVGYSSR